MEVVDSCAYARIGMCLSWDFCPKAVGKPVPYADSKFCSRNLTVEVRIVSLLSYIYRYSKITLADGQFFFLSIRGTITKDSHYSSLYVLRVREASKM